MNRLVSVLRLLNDKDEEVSQKDDIRHLATEEQPSPAYSRLNYHLLVGRSSEGQIRSRGETRRIETRFPEPVRAAQEDILARRHRSRPERFLRPANNVGSEL